MNENWRIVSPEEYKFIKDKTMIMEKYLPYKGLWWKITPPISENGMPMWKISERKDDSICHVWMFNAFTFSRRLLPLYKERISYRRSIISRYNETSTDRE